MERHQLRFATFWHPNIMPNHHQEKHRLISEWSALNLMSNKHKLWAVSYEDLLLSVKDSIIKLDISLSEVSSFGHMGTQVQLRLSEGSAVALLFSELSEPSDINSSQSSVSQHIRKMMRIWPSFIYLFHICNVPPKISFWCTSRSGQLIQDSVDSIDQVSPLQVNLIKYVA